jgi:hypothetical protein
MTEIGFEIATVFAIMLCTSLLAYIGFWIMYMVRGFGAVEAFFQVLNLVYANEQNDETFWKQFKRRPER